MNGQQDVHHDIAATEYGAHLVREARAGNAPWSGFLSARVSLVSSYEWPVPDGVLTDSRRSCALEFKPAGHHRREYVTGLGQAVSYLERHDMSLLILPERSIDGFAITDYVATVLGQTPANGLPIGLAAFDNAGVLQLRRAPATSDWAPQQRARLSRTHWAPWREISFDELHKLLRRAFGLSQRQSGTQVRSVKRRAFMWLRNKILQGQTLSPDGRARRIRSFPANANFLNYSNFVSHLGLWDSLGRPTEDGLELLHVADVYGVDSVEFRDGVARQTLIAGRHLGVICKIQEIQDRQGRIRARNTREHDRFLEREFAQQGLLVQRPGAVTTGARMRFQSERTFWRRVGILKTAGREHFVRGKGYLFDWNRITSILRKDS